MVTPKIELHVHLDGALKHETAWELLNKKNLPLPGDGSYQAFLDAILVKSPSTLMNFLQGFGVFLPAVIGDLEAIERMAFEFCEYQSEEGVIYAEARFCPHLLLPESFTEANFLNHTTANLPNGTRITIEDIVCAVLNGFKKGEESFGIIVRTILSCIRGKPEWSQDILNLCIQFKGKGVVGIDIAGDEGGEHPIKGEESEQRMLDKEDVEVFTKAKELGIHRTVHAGEAGPAIMVKKALEVLHAERIGHGYRVLEDEKIYQDCLDKRIHFECCPTSSLLTGSVLLQMSKEHPIVRFSHDNASFSVNTDDPTVTNTKLSDEYNLLRNWGITEEQIKQCNIEAIKNSFAETEVKEIILTKLMKAYGMS